MEQHPVPQNVTTFQFRLIGDMTLKQFGYLAGGAILGYICYKLPIPVFLSWPLAAIATIMGVGLAFFPVEERPLDVWVLSFFKSVYSPTQYVWTKRAPAPPAPPPTAAPVPPTTAHPVSTFQPTVSPAAPQQMAQAPATGRKGDILQNIFSPTLAAGGVLTTETKTATGPFDWVFKLLTPRPRPHHPAPGKEITRPTLASRMDFTPPPSVIQTQRAIDETTKKETEIEGRLKTVQTALTEPQVAETRVLELQKQLTELLTQHQKMEDELRLLRQQAAPSPVADLPNPPPDAPVSTGMSVATPPGVKPQTVQIITADRAVKAGLPRLTTFPNVVTGIVKDSEQNLLPGVLVTVKDKDGVPLRALKTNRLGQFAASTPLPNGIYLVEIEDPRFRYAFDRAQITLNGSIVPALEIFAKSQKEITRAKLEKELFGKPT